MDLGGINQDSNISKPISASPQMCRCGQGSEHSHISSTVTINKSLHPYIDFTHTTLNQARDAQLQTLIRASFSNGFGFSMEIKENSVITVTFVEAVKLKSVLIHGSGLKNIDLFANPKNVAVMQTNPTQSFIFGLTEPDSLIEFPVRVVSFTKLKSLSLKFISGSNAINLQYLGFVGELQQGIAKAVIANYELKPQVVDHAYDDLKPTMNLGM